MLSSAWLHMATIPLLHLLLCIEMSSYHLGNYEVSASQVSSVSTLLESQLSVLLNMCSFDLLKRKHRAA